MIEETTPEWWIKALSDFGNSLGFPDADGWRENLLNLSMDDGKYLLDVERSSDQIIVAVFRDAPLPQLDEYIQHILTQCSFEHYRSHFLQTGLRGENTLVLAVRLHYSQAQQMYEVLALIRKVFAAVGL